MRQRTARIWLGAGLVLVIGSIIGLVLAVGTLLSLQINPEKMLVQMRDSAAVRLAATGLPADVVAHVREGRDIPENQRTALTEDQLRDLDWVLEEMLPTVTESLELAASQSRTKSQFGIGVCAAVLVVGVIAYVVGMRGHRTTNS